VASDTSLVFNILAKDKASKVFDKVKGSAAVAGVAIGAALTAGVAEMLAQSKTSALLEAQLGAGTPAAAQAGKAAGDVYARGVAGSIEEANAAVKAAIQNALVPPDASAAAIDAVASKITNLGVVMEEDADRVSSAVSQMIRTGLVKSAAEGFDLLQKGVEGGVNKSQDLLDTFNEYGTQFRKLGLQGPQAMGLISQAVKAGARDSDTAADALKEFSIRAIDGSKKTAEGYKMLGLDGKLMGANVAKGGDFANEALAVTLEKLRGIKDPVKQSAAATALFGTKAEDLGDALYAMNPETAADALGKVGGAADAAGKKLEESAGAKLESFKRQAQAALIDKLAEAVPYIESTFGWLSKNSSWVTPLAVGLGALAAAIYVIVLATRAWSAIQTVLNLSLWTSPITWIIVGIVALVAVIVLIATKTTWFQTIWKYLWGFLKAVGAWFAGPFKNFFVSTWKAISSAASSALNWMEAKALGFWNWIKSVPGWIRDKWNAMWSSLKTAGSGALAWVKGKALTFYNWITSIPGKVSAKLKGMWNGLKDGFRSAINWVIGKWNNFSIGLPGFSFAGVDVPGISINTPDIPYLAKGGNVQRSGMAMVGEKGPEVLSLNRGAQVTPLSRAAGAGGGRLVIDVTGADTEMKRLIRKLIRAEGL
jgi:phage-related minor tail protein